MNGEPEGRREVINEALVDEINSSLAEMSESAGRTLLLLFADLPSEDRREAIRLLAETFISLNTQLLAATYVLGCHELLEEWQAARPQLEL